MKKFAVFGNPIVHSKSPDIHQAFASQFAIDLSYKKILVDKGQFPRFADHFFSTGGSGANVTIPFKEEALQFADTVSEEARLAGAVNTLSKKDTVIIGDNTDGIGLLRDMVDNHKQLINDKNILLIGAGGAARGVILPIAGQHPRSITVANRTHEKAETLAKQFSPYARITACRFTELNKVFDIVINATSVSLAGQKLSLSADIFAGHTFAYDMMYAAKPTAFMHFAKDCGASVSDGLGMLVEQAAKSFEIWHGVRPDTADVIASIRCQLNSH